MDDSATALAAAALLVAAIGLIASGALAMRLRRLRRDQRAVLGEAGEDDLVAHAALLAREVAALRSRADDLERGLIGRLEACETRLGYAVRHSAVIRYDAYNEMSGQQSSSIALFDDHRSGVVLSSIIHRDQARLYAKEVIAGEPQVDLSPEERAAMEQALDRG